MSPRILEAQAITEAAPSAHVIRELPILVILPHSRCNCRCVMCDIWRIRQVREITARIWSRTWPACVNSRCSGWSFRAASL